MSIAFTAVSIDWEYLLIALLLIGVSYAVGGYILQSTTPGGKLSWSGRRWRWTFTVALALWACGIPISGFSSFPVRVFFYGILGLFGILFIRWWWRDWEKEKATREELVERLHQEGRELVLPRMSRGQKVWNWILIAYGVAGLLGGLYEIVLHSLKK